MVNFKNSIPQVVRRVSLVMAIATLLGCQTAERFPPASEAPPLPSPDINLRPGDEVEVKFFYTPKLDVIQKIRSDGRIQLQLIGEVDAAGKTPGLLREELLALYMAHLKDPEVAVIVRSVISQRVYVGGQVNKPGLIEMSGELSVLDAIINAGGFRLPEAEIQNVIVVRHQGTERQGYSIDFKPMLANNEEVQPFLLQPQDIVFVPRTPITKVDQWVDQYINRIMPRTPFDYNID